MKIISIIITYYGMNEERKKFLFRSLNSLFRTIKNLPVEVILIDNGGVTGAYDYVELMNMVRIGQINTYIRNDKNMHFGYARQQGLAICNGEYIVIADSDILYARGWLELCLSVLEKYPDEKIYATPLYNVAHWLDKYWSDKTLEVDGEKFKLNRRAGSNCFVISRKNLETIGTFYPHRVAGTKWTEEAYEKGYWAAVCPRTLAEDIGFRKGYNYKTVIPIKEILSNGEEVYFNRDEFKRNNSGLHYSQQKRFNPSDYKTFVE